MTMLGICCCMDFSLVAGNRYHSLVAKHWLWGERASVVVTCGLSNCSSQALEHGLNSCDD